MIEEKFTPAVMEFPKPDLKMKAEEKNMTTTIDYSVVVPSSERKDFFYANKSQSNSRNNRNM